MEKCWKVPQALGGGIFEGLEGSNYDLIYLKVPGMATPIRVAASDVEEVKPLPPMEPIVGTVVLDKHKVAWQRQGNQWFPAADVNAIENYQHIGSLMWGLLNDKFGPLSVLAVVETDQS